MKKPLFPAQPGLLGALALVFLAACGGGGGSSSPPPPTTVVPTDPVTPTPVVKIVSATGCEIGQDKSSCDISAVIDANAEATIQVVGGGVATIQAGNNQTVKMASGQYGANTVMATLKGATSAAVQAVVSVSCASGLSLDTVTGKCLAPAPVVVEMAFAIGGRWAIPAVLDAGYTELQNDTGKVLINCMLPKIQSAPYTLIPGLCSEVNGAVANWYAVNYDPVAKTIIANPGGDVNPDNFDLSSNQFDAVKSWSQSTSTTNDGITVTYYVKAVTGNAETTGGDVWRSEGGVERLIRDVNVSTDGSVGHMATYKVIRK